jgi:hypothetical protein
VASSQVCEYSQDLSFGSGSSGTAASPVRQLSRISGLREEDKRTFDHFISKSAPRIAGSFDKDFWCGKVLGMSLKAVNKSFPLLIPPQALAHHEPVILDAVLAISVLYEHPQYMKSFLTCSEGDYPSPHDHPALSEKPIDQFHAKALKHYNRSIRALRYADPSEVSPTVALLSCALFACIEVQRDDVFAALALLKNGVMLIKRFSTYSGDLDLEVFENIKQMFSRMCLVTALFGHLEPMDALVERPTPLDQNVEFRSLEGARSALCRLMAGL